MQCAVTFTATQFNITVNVSERNITVHKMIAPGPSGPTITDLDPYGNITLVVMRQLALISADQTSFYRSTLGDMFNASISDYRALIKNNTSTTKSISESEVNLKGAENTVISLVDDMLVAYASAQLVVGGLTVPARAFVNAEAIRAGSPGYIIASAVIIILIVILVTVEAVRMRGWRALPAFDYTDTRMLVVGASRGGQGIAEYVGRERDKDWGSVLIMLSGGTLPEDRLIHVGKLL